MEHQPQILLIGHSGSTSAHPIIAKLTHRLRQELSDMTIIYGGVFPTYHFRDILAQEAQIDIIVRGEVEATVAKLIAVIESGDDLAQVKGIAFRHHGQIVVTPPAPMIKDLDAYRVGWELINPKRYSYYGGKRAVVMQFSRGFPWMSPSL